jgi:hypothetical protein
MDRFLMPVDTLMKTYSWLQNIKRDLDFPLRPCVKNLPLGRGVLYGFSQARLPTPSLLYIGNE